MEDAKGQLEKVGLVRKELIDVTFHNLEPDVANPLYQIMKSYKGNAGRAAAQELVNRYYLAEQWAQIQQQVAILDARLSAIEELSQSGVKTFGGGKI